MEKCKFFGREDIDLVKCFNIIKENQAVLLKYFSVFLFTGITILKLADKIYMAKSAVLLPNRNNNIISLTLSPELSASSSNFQAVFNSRDIIECLAEKIEKEKPDSVLKISTLYRIKQLFGWPCYDHSVARDKLIEKIYRSIASEVSIDMPNVLTLKYFDKDPKRAKENLEILVQKTFEKLETIHMKKSEGKIKFISEQVRLWENKLRDEEERLRDYQDVNGFFHIDRETSGLIDLVSKYTAEIESMKINNRINEMKIGEFKEALPGIEKEFVSSQEESKNHVVDNLKTQITDLTYKIEISKINGMKEEHPEIILMKEELAEMQKLMKTEVLKDYSGTVTSFNPTYKEIHDKIVVAEVEQKINNQTIAIYESLYKRYEGEILKLPTVNLEFVKVSRAKKIAENLYLLFMNKLEEEKIEQQNNVKDEQILESSYALSNPVKPNFLISMVIILVGSAALSLVLIFVKIFGVLYFKYNVWCRVFPDAGIIFLDDVNKCLEAMLMQKKGDILILGDTADFFRSYSSKKSNSEKIQKNLHFVDNFYDDNEWYGLLNDVECIYFIVGSDYSENRLQKLSFTLEKYQHMISIVIKK